MAKPPQEKRLHPRLECSGKADVWFAPDAPPHAAKILDLSMVGGLIELDTPYTTRSGSTVEVMFTVNQLPFRVRAQVRAVRSPTTFGVLFDATTKRATDYLRDVIAELTEEDTKRQASKEESLKKDKGGASGNFFQDDPG